MGAKETFGSRLRSLRDDMKQEDLAKTLGISRASVGYYENGTRTPDIEVLETVAKHFSVSCDWLLGLSDVKRNDIEIRAIAEKTGMTELSITNLVDEINLIEDYQKRKDCMSASFHESYISLVNALLENHSQLYSAAKVYSGLCDALKKCDYDTEIDNLADAWDLLDEQDKPENNNKFVLSAGEKAEYCLYLLGQIFPDMIKRAGGWVDE